MSTATNSNETLTILNKQYRWSLYAFLINMISFTLLNGLILTLLILHRNVDSSVTIKNWVISLTGILLELLAGGIAFLDSYRKNPKERLFGSRIFNLPIYAITLIITVVIFWNSVYVFPIVYGGVCGGFAGYLAGGLAYPNFFIKIKDVTFRITFGGWIGVFLGSISGSVIAFLIEFYVNDFPGGPFGGIFMGFWGGALVSGPIATALLALLQKREKFTFFFTKLLIYGAVEEVAEDLEKYFNTTGNENLDINSCDIFIEYADNDIQAKNESDKTIWKKILRVLIFIVYLTNPWEQDMEKYRIDTFKQIFTLAAQKKGYEMSENVITI
ncbi:MAG: hypothetical protein JXA54_02920 [Candidatus Heimdallarchaeota archaeon]|nr:hypothetical protein [Candidatus Heimdallarchaeota archaeon]